MPPSDEALPSYCLPPGMSVEAVEPGGGAASSAATVRIVTRRPLVPGEAEQRANARSRSAKLRVVEKL